MNQVIQNLNISFSKHLRSAMAFLKSSAFLKYLFLLIGGIVAAQVLFILMVMTGLPGPFFAEPLQSF